jgi:hypothetical protein
MNETVAVALIGACLVLAAWSLVMTVRGRPFDNPLFYGVAALELALVALLVGGSIALARTQRDVNGAEFVGYLLTALFILPLAVVWAVAEKSRWGNGVLVLACLVLAVMVLRIQDIWNGAGA